jgi:hypothetical protein
MPQPDSMPIKIVLDPVENEENLRSANKLVESLVEPLVEPLVKAR